MANWYIKRVSLQLPLTRSSLNKFEMIYILRNMSHVGKITVVIKTGDVTNAPTNGRVYLGLGGREFRLNKPGDQFKRGATDTFIIGDGGNIDNPRNANDLPFVTGTANAPVIEYSTLGLYPKYVRLEPKDDDDDWNVETVNGLAELYFGTGGSGVVTAFSDLPGTGNIWLGIPFGKVLDLR
jgi:hypothetical protein